MNRNEYEKLPVADLVLTAVDGTIIPVIETPEGQGYRLRKPARDVSITPGGHPLTASDMVSVTFVFPAKKKAPKRVKKGR